MWAKKARFDTFEWEGNENEGGHEHGVGEWVRDERRMENGGGKVTRKGENNNECGKVADGVGGEGEKLNVRSGQGKVTGEGIERE